MTLILAVMLSSCSKEEIGGTATQEVAGDWYVTVVACDANDNILYEDDQLFGMGHWHCFSYNTAANVPTQMIISDQGNFWDYIAVVNVDPVSKTFSTENNDFVQNLSYDCKVKITNGKIVIGGGKQNNGSVADCIEYDIVFDDDDNAGVAYDHLKVRGVRYSGLADND